MVKSALLVLALASTYMIAIAAGPGVAAGTQLTTIGGDPCDAGGASSTDCNAFPGQPADCMASISACTGGNKYKKQAGGESCQVDDPDCDPLYDCVLNGDCS